MKNITKLLITGAVAGLIGLGSPNYVQAQNQTQEQTQKNNPWFDKKYKTYIEDFGLPTSKYWTHAFISENIYGKVIKTWLCDCPKEQNQGNIFIHYMDTNDDGFFNSMLIQNVENKLTMLENFKFYPATKKIDYTLDFRKREGGKTPDKCEQVLEKSYDGITLQEAHSIGENFVKRANRLISAQKRYNRFNTSPLDSLVREEKWEWGIKYKEGKYEFARTGFPIYKHFSEQEIKTLEDALKQ